jgi:SP family sugar:H+ symporter-like MFS transporter
MASQPAPVVRVLPMAAVAALGGFLFGFDTAIINGAVVALRNEFAISDLAVALTVSLALLGSAAGAFIAGPIADRIGRIRTMAIAASLFTISALGSGLPFGVYDFTAWRLIGGMAVGMASVIAPAYIAEVSPAQYRGRLGSLQQLAIVIGIFVALLMNLLIARAAGSAEAAWLLGLDAWQWMFLSEVAPAVLYGIGALTVPESPRYLVAKGRLAEAKQVLERVAGGDVDRKIDEIRDSLASDTPPRLRDVVGGRFGFLPIVWLGIGLSVLQQFVGINVVFYYSTLLWQQVGFSEQAALTSSMVVSVTNVLTTLVAIATIDRFGRRPLLLAGSIGMVLTLGMMAVVFATAPLNDANQPQLGRIAAWTALIAMNLYVVCFGFSWGPVVWVLLGEMFPNRLRGSALSIAAGAQWIANFAISTSFPPMAGGLGLGVAYGLYAFFALVSFFYVLSLVRETKGMELEQMR